MKNKKKLLNIALSTSEALWKVMKEVEDKNYRITNKLVAYINVKTGLTFVGYMKETPTKFLITNKVGNVLTLQKGDDGNYRDDSYLFYEVELLIEHLELLLDGQ